MRPKQRPFNIEACKGIPGKIRAKSGSGVSGMGGNVRTRGHFAAKAAREPSPPTPRGRLQRPGEYPLQFDLTVSGLRTARGLYSANVRPRSRGEWTVRSSQTRGGRRHCAICPSQADWARSLTGSPGSPALQDVASGCGQDSHAVNAQQRNTCRQLVPHVRRRADADK